MSLESAQRKGVAVKETLFKPRKAEEEPLGLLYPWNILAWTLFLDMLLSKHLFFC